MEEDHFVIGQRVRVEFNNQYVVNYSFMARDGQGLLVRALTSGKVVYVPWSSIFAVVFGIEDVDDPQP